MKILVSGAGGMLGGHLVGRLLSEGHEVRAVDIKPLHEWYQFHLDAENVCEQDLKNLHACEKATSGMDEVYNLAADMGGIGFIEGHKAECMLSVLITTHMLLAAKEARPSRFFQASSACVYPDYRQDASDVVALREEYAYPAMPEDGYGWEKLFGERMCRHFLEDFGLETRVARYHNLYGPHLTFDGGREKAPAAICRKVAIAKLTGADEIEIWGDGQQTRSFCFTDDAVEGTIRLTRSGVAEPLNIGSDELVTINELVDIVEDIAGIKLKRRYNLLAPQGVRGRNSDNNLVRNLLGWEPSTSLRSGLGKTYPWVYDQVAKQQNL